MDPRELRQILDRAPGLSIGVLGDFCLDAYLTLDARASENSVETGLPTRPVRAQRYSLGGAGNVANNLRAIGVGQVPAYGVIGNDPFGKEMQALLQDAAINDASLLIQKDDWDTHVYVKPIENAVEGSRIDFGNFNSLHSESAKKLLDQLGRDLPSLDALIINQQVVHGIHSDEFRTSLRELIRRHPGKLVLSDSRHFSDDFDGTIRRINAREGAVLLGKDADPQSWMSASRTEEMAHDLFERWKKPLFLSRGEYGCAVYDEGGYHDIPGLQIVSPIDPVGAGDSMMAGISVGLAAGLPPDEAARLGTFVAGVTVQKLFITGTASPPEILAIGSDPDYRFRPELARNPLRAVFHPGSEIEIVTTLPRDRTFRNVIFDQDGTLSTLRQGWEEIMEPMMVNAILGEHAREVDDVTFDRVTAAARNYIDKTTGIQTIVQMKGLVNLVRQFGLVPDDRILTESGYKELYNRDLLTMVNGRIRKLAAGELDPEDFAVKKALPFLAELHTRGLVLHLASGTDEADVRREAEILGYARYFGGRITGSIGDITRDAKKIVLEKILKEIGGNATPHVLTFGDGPVEIRETHKRGGYTVGVASNEIRRHGLDPAKRRRLIEAGADVIIPDYSQMQTLLSLLFPS